MEEKSIPKDEGAPQEESAESDSPQSDTADAVSQIEEEEHPSGLGKKKRMKVLMLIAAGIVGGTLVAGAAFYVLQLSGAPKGVLSFVPATADYYLGIRIGDEDPQVAQGRELMERFPGGAKWADVFDNAIELFGQPLDPFQEVLTLAEDEIFLAKVRQPDEEDQRRFRGRGLIDELINIVRLGTTSDVELAMKDILGRNGRTVEEKSSFGSSYWHVVLDELDEESTTVTLDPLPHQVTIPYSLETYLFGHDRFLISGDAEEDIWEVAKLLEEGEADSRVLDITTQASHQEVTSHFPTDPLLRFYQQQEVVPQFGIFPWEIFTGFIVDSALPIPRASALAAGLLDTVTPIARGQESSTSVGRGVTLDMRDEGAVMTIYSEILDTRQFTNTFSVSDSNAMQIPMDLNGSLPMLHIETANLWDKVRGFRAVLEDGAKQSENEETREVYADALEDFEDAIKEISELWGVDFERDILSWMDGNASVTLGARFGGLAPTYVFTFGTSDAAAAKAGIEKILIEDSSAGRRDRSTTREMNTLGRAILDFFDENGRDPLDLDELKVAMVNERMVRYESRDYYDEEDLVRLREGQEGSVEGTLTDNEGERYGYRAIEGGAGFVLETTLDDGRTYSWSYVPGEELLRGVYTGDADPEFGKIRPETVSILGADAAYRLRFTTSSDNFPFSTVYIAVTDSAVYISESVGTLEAILAGSDEVFGRSEGFSAQFSGAPNDLAGLYFIEPYGFWGIGEYIVTLFGEDLEEFYKEIEEDQEAQDMLVAAQAYLKTLKDIGGYFVLEGRTVIVPTLFRIVELPEVEKNRAEVAVDRLLRANEGETVYTGGSPAQERDAKRLADLGAVRLALEVYADQHQSVYSSVSAGQENGPSAETFNQIADAMVKAQLLSARPVDPTSGRNYVAQLNAKSNPTSYILGADLETDQAACNTDYDKEDLVGGGLMCAEVSAGDCSGPEPDGVDYCICQGQACK